MICHCMWSLHINMMFTILNSVHTTQLLGIDRTASELNSGALDRDSVYSSCQSSMPRHSCSNALAPHFLFLCNSPQQHIISCWELISTVNACTCIVYIRSIEGYQNLKIMNASCKFRILWYSCSNLKLSYCAEFSILKLPSGAFFSFEFRKTRTIPLSRVIRSKHITFGCLTCNTVPSTEYQDQNYSGENNQKG